MTIEEKNKPLNEVIDECGGLIGRIMEYTMEQAHRPNRYLAFAGAAAFVAHIAGRRFRTAANGRPNIYILAHAWSGVGKGAPRDTNFRLAKACDMTNTVIEDFRSGEALQDVILTNGRVMSQYDEADTLFDSIKKSKDAVGVNTLGEMLKVWEKSKNFLVRRQLAKSVKGRSDDKTPSIAYHPHFTLFATGVTSEVYKSISDKMAKNGFFARLFVIDGGKRGKGQNPIYREIPKDICDDCRTVAGWRDDKNQWYENKPEWNDSGHIITTSADALEYRKECERDADSKYNSEEDGVENAVYARSVEKMEKWAMIIAISDNPAAPTIEKRHWVLARKLVDYSDRHMIEMLKRYSSETDYEDLQKRIIRRLEKGITCNRALLAALHIKNDDLKEAVETLQKAGRIIFCDQNGVEVAEYAKGISYALA